ncbi:MAG TPA: aldo/keto reductase [Gaiellaceae bacterium]|nr:aldo/keto reductase [Gaiellaceae bacterium]
MERRRLGAAGPEITVVGIGTAPIGSGREWVYWGGQDEADAIAAIRAGLDVGANWIDTAPFYGWGRAEEIVRRALEGRRDDVLLFTKCGTMPDPERVSRMDNSPDAIRADVEASLLRLGVDHVDLLQIHDLDRATPIEESWGELQTLIGEGKIRWAGLSNHPAELVERAHAIAPVTSCQESLSLLEGPKHPDVLEVVRRHGIGLLCWAPLASGFLVDGFSTDALEPDDFRRSSPLAERTEEIDAHRRDAAARGRTLRRHAVAWVLEQPGVTAAIVGPRTAAEGTELAALAAD